MTGHPADKGAKGNVLRLPDATQPRRPDDDGYETDVTTFSDAGYTTEGNTPTSEAQGLLQGALWGHCSCIAAHQLNAKRAGWRL